MSGANILKISKFFCQMKFSILAAERNFCILHGHVFVIHIYLDYFPLVYNQILSWAIGFLSCETNEPPHGKTNNLHMRICAYAKTKAQISFAVTAKLISIFVFDTHIVQSLYFLNMKFHASSCSPVCLGPGRKPQRWFSHEAAHIFTWIISL